MQRIICLVAALFILGVLTLAAGSSTAYAFGRNDDWLGLEPARGEELVTLIRENVEPDTWIGDKTVSFRAGFLIVVHQQHVHEKIERLLLGLRRASPYTR